MRREGKDGAGTPGGSRSPKGGSERRKKPQGEERTEEVQGSSRKERSPGESPAGCYIDVDSLLPAHPRAERVFPGGPQSFPSSAQTLRWNRGEKGELQSGEGLGPQG